jgi:hypothetical protein
VERPVTAAGPSTEWRDTPFPIWGEWNFLVLL